jgi:putative transposase
LSLITQIRQDHPVIGGRKLHQLLKIPFVEHGIEMGRDRLFNLMREQGLLKRKRRCKAITTWSRHPFYKYKNLIKGVNFDLPEQLWVSDITFLKTENGFLYLSLITDAYSKKIVGYDLSNNLESVNALAALKMAIGTKRYMRQLIHHSDRGIQYCSHEYTKLLKQCGIKISMTENGDPKENAIAERINGILKHEYLLHDKLTNYHTTHASVEHAIRMYNEKRPHLSCNMKTPSDVHHNELKTNKLWKTYYRKKIIVNQYQD